MSPTTLEFPPQNDRQSDLPYFGVMAQRGLHVMWIRGVEFVFVFIELVVAFASSFLGDNGAVRHG